MSQIESFPSTQPEPSQVLTKKPKPKRTTFTVSKVAQPTPALCISTTPYRSLKWAHRVEAGMCVTVKDTGGKVVLEVIRGSELIQQVILSDLTGDAKAVSKLIYSKVSVMLRYPYPPRQDFTQPFTVYRFQLTLPPAQVKALLALLAPFFSPAESDAAKATKGQGGAGKTAEAAQTQRVHPYERSEVREPKRSDAQVAAASARPAEPAPHHLSGWHPDTQIPFEEPHHKSHDHRANPNVASSPAIPDGVALQLPEQHLTSQAPSHRHDDRLHPNYTTQQHPRHDSQIAPSFTPAARMPDVMVIPHSPFGPALSRAYQSAQYPPGISAPIDQHQQTLIHPLLQQQQLQPQQQHQVQKSFDMRNPQYAPGPHLPPSQQSQPPVKMIPTQWTPAPKTPKGAERSLICFDSPQASASTTLYPPLQPSSTQTAPALPVMMPSAPVQVEKPARKPDFNAENSLAVQIRSCSSLYAMDVEDVRSLLMEVVHEQGFPEFVAKVSAACRIQASIEA